jgi:DNA-binding transcriptional LysR family regulator
MTDEIRAMAIFAKVAETGSFRGAALIYRSIRSFSLTHDGQNLFGSAQRMVAAAEEGLTVFSEMSADPVGVIPVSMPQLLNNPIMIRAFTSFANLYPGIALRLSFSDLQSNLIRDGIDIAFRIGPTNDSALKTSKIGDIARCMVASPSYVARHSKPKEPADLERWAFIRLAAIPDETIVTHPDKGIASILGEDQISVDNSQALVQFALAGAGVASMLEFAVQEAIDAGLLMKLLPDWELSKPGLFVLWPPNAPRRSLAQKLLEHLRNELPPFWATDFERPLQ